MIDKTDEKALSSTEYFKFFASFVDGVVKSMPKEEKKRAAAKPPAGGAAAAKKFNMGDGAKNMVAELKMKQGG